jgi:hypothetical protein
VRAGSCVAAIPGVGGREFGLAPSGIWVLSCGFGLN